MKCLVTGGAGFLGSHLVDRLVQEGHGVSVVDNLSSGKKENLPDHIRFYELDVRDKNIIKVFAKEQPEIVFHCAAHIEARESVKDPIADAEVNILGSLRVLDAAKNAGAKKFVFASSGGEVYGNVDELPAREDHTPVPISPYGAAKYSVEHYLHSYSELFGLSSIAVRYGNIYGPRQNPDGEAGVVAIFIKRMLNGDDVIIHGDGKQTKDYIYIEDAIEATVLAAQNDVEGSLNIGTGREVSVLEIYNELKEITSCTGSTRHDVHPAEIFPKRVFLSTKLAQEKLQWAAKTDFHLGLEKTVQWFKEQQA